VVGGVVDHDDLRRSLLACQVRGFRAERLKAAAEQIARVPAHDDDGEIHKRSSRRLPTRMSGAAAMRRARPVSAGAKPAVRMPAARPAATSIGWSPTMR